MVGVDGGLFGEKNEDADGLWDGWAGSDISWVDVVMLRPPHFGHLLSSASPESVDARGLATVLFLPLRRG